MFSLVYLLTMSGNTEIAQRVLSSQMEKVEQNQFNNLFQTFFAVMERRCRVIIDGETCNNLASLELVEKLGLTTKPHPHPYYMQWVNSYDKIKITEFAHIEFSIGFYKSSADFDIVPMQACHLLLGTPWININDVVHKKVVNRYSFNYNGRKITLKSMTATEILEADLERAERRKNEPFRKEWIISDVTVPSSKSDFVQIKDIALSSVGPNILQHVSKTEDKVIENEQVIVSGKSSLDVLKLSTTHAIIEQHLVDTKSELTLSHDKYSTDFCDKEELCDSSMFIPVPQLVKETDPFVLEPKTYAKNKHLIPIATEKDERKLLSSLNTLGYIEFDTLCALSSLEEKFKCVGLPWLSRCTYHFIGNYNCKGEYMVHRVYMCSNLKSPFAMQQFDEKEGYFKTNPITQSSSCSSLFVLSQQVQFQEGEQRRIMSRMGTTTSASISDFESRTTQNQEGENDEDMTNTHMTKAQAKIEFKAQSTLKSDLFASPVRTAGAGLTKTDAQATYGLRFGRSIYRWKAKEISFPTQLIPYQNTLGVDGNRRNNMTTRICLDAATPVFGPEGLVLPRVARPPPWPPP